MPPSPLRRKVHRRKPRRRKKKAATVARPSAFKQLPASKPAKQGPVKPPATPAQPPPPQPPRPDPDPPALYEVPSQGAFGRPQAERLLWRAGFGPMPGDADRLAAMGLDAAVRSLVYPGAPAQLVGPEPYDAGAGALAPQDLWGHDGLWWLDRMVRSTHQLQERMTLIWHDWFATSDDKVSNRRMMLDQNATMRANALGSFRTMLHDVTHDQAMLVWLDGLRSTRWNPNENYAREIMELFTLGAGRGAYTETDVRELARAFTGYNADWVAGTGWTNFRIQASYRDTGSKTIFGQTGAWGIDDGWRMCLEHPMHPSFFVTKLWSYFVPTPPDAGTQGALQALYVDGGYAIAPVVEAILKHPDFYAGPAMVKPPVVYAAGLLRASGRTIDTYDWAWLLPMAGQELFVPPNVAGWDDARWLDTSTWRGRWYLAVYALRPQTVDPWARTYSSSESAAWAVENALRALGSPSGLSPELRDGLRTFAEQAATTITADWQKSPYRAMRFNALRMLVATSSDYQAC
jgi:hypothetical protein